MIQTETITINGTEYRRTYSDAGMYIERDGAQYSEAVDVMGSRNVYTETDEAIPIEDELYIEVNALMAEFTRGVDSIDD